MNRIRPSTELIREGKYAAEVDIKLEYTDESWSPTMSGDDAGFSLNIRESNARCIA